jgi:hypothetical protein
MRVSCVLAAALLFPAAVSAAAWQAPAPSPPGQTPPAPAGASPQSAPVPPATGTSPADPGKGPAATVPPLPARTFTAPVGLLFNAVRADRVQDFEKVLAYLRAALEKSTDPTISAQAKGWRIFKAGEPGPDGTVLYVFGFDPTVPGADYGLGRILAEAYPDAAQLQEIWRLYQGAVTSGGSLMNLTPVTPPALPPPNAPAPGIQPTTRP